TRQAQQILDEFISRFERTDEHEVEWKYGENAQRDERPLLQGFSGNLLKPRQTHTSSRPLLRRGGRRFRRIANRLALLAPCATSPVRPLIRRQRPAAAQKQPQRYASGYTGTPSDRCNIP